MTKELHFKCLGCGHVYASYDAKRRRYSDGTVDRLCPICDNDEYEEVEQCVDCGEWFDPAELYGSFGECRCEDCLERAVDIDTALEYGEETPMEINGLFEYIFTPEQIKQILLDKIDGMYNENEKLCRAREYCMSDIDGFADFISKREAQI